MKTKKATSRWAVIPEQKEYYTRSMVGVAGRNKEH